MLILFDFLPLAPAIAADPSSLCPFGHQRLARGQPWREAPPCSLASIKQELTLAACASVPSSSRSLLTLDLGRKGLCLLQEIRPALELDYFGSPCENSGGSLGPASSSTSQYMEKCKLYQVSEGLLPFSHAWKDPRLMPEREQVLLKGLPAFIEECVGLEKILKPGFFMGIDEKWCI